MRMLIVAGMLLSVAGCASEPKQFTGPDGRPALTVKCASWGESMETCYEKARTACGGNYDVIATVNDRKPVPSTSVTSPVRSLSFSCT